VPDSGFQFDEESGTARLSIDMPFRDRFQVFGPGDVPGKTHLEATYQITGKGRKVVPLTSDPTSPFNWAGMMWPATESMDFTVAYDDGTFSASGHTDFASSVEQFGQLGHERNGFFASH